MKKRNSFIYLAHTSLFFFEKFLNLNEKFSMTFEDDVVSSMWCFADIRAFEFFTTRSSNIIYQEFSFFFSNFFFMSSFIFIFADFSSTSIVFFFFSFFFSSFIYCSVAALSRKIVSTICSFVFVKRFQRRRFFRWNRFIKDWVWWLMSKIYFLSMS